MKIGDRVAVVDEDLSGTIVSIQDSYVVFEDIHGFSQKYAKEKLVVHDRGIYTNSSPIKKKEEKSKTSKKHNNSPFTIDLHFDKLVSKPSNYSSWERLSIQREKLIEMLDYCRNNNLKKINIIYGIGDGVLQKMVFEILTNSHDLEFENHDFFYHQSGSADVFIITK